MADAQADVGVARGVDGGELDGNRVGRGGAKVVGWVAAANSNGVHSRFDGLLIDGSPEIGPCVADFAALLSDDGLRVGAGRQAQTYKQKA